MQWPGKHIAFVFSDPAGANACIALSRMNFPEPSEYPRLFSNKKHFWGKVENFQMTEAVPDFESLGIDCVFTGTSHPASSRYFEVNCIREAKKKNIYTISFVDHWVNFRLRFEGLEPNELPDEIWVVDDKARELAIKEGLDTARLRVHENPYHTYLKKRWESSFEKKTYLENLGIPQTGYHILFAPDPLSIRNGKERAGFTESEAFLDLKEALTKIDRKVHLMIKSHPLQPHGIFESLTETAGLPVYILPEVDVLEIIHASDLVIGFYSNILLEAEALGKDVLRYFPGKKEADLLQHKSSLKLARNRQELEKELKHCIYG